MSTCVERVENQINNPVDPVQFILDKRIPLKLLQVDNGENVIYCKKFREDLFDSGVFSTKEKDFVHNYISENEQKYIITDVSTPDGKTYKNVKFKVVVKESGETPYSTFSANVKTVINEKVVLPENKIVQDLDILEKTKQNDFERKRIEQAEERLENKKNRLIQEEQQLLNKKLLLKEEKEKILSDQKEKEKEIQEKYKIIKEAKDDIIASSRQYLEEKLKASSEENKNYARRILELGGGGGSVAVQYANGGTMNGDLNVNGVVNATGGNSNQWNSTYSTVKSLSDSWEESVFITPLQAASASWNSVYSTTNSNSAKWESNYSSFNSSSASYDSVYSTVKSLSDSWEESVFITPLQNASGSWNSVYSNVNSNSAIWSTVQSNITADNVLLRDSSTSVGNVNFGQNISKLSGPAINGLNDKVTLWDFRGTGSGFNYAIGAEGNHVWFTMDVNNNTGGFKFYSRNNQIFKIRSDGSLLLNPGNDILDSSSLDSLLLSTKNKSDSVYSTVKSLSDSWEESAFITPLQNASGSWDSVYTSVKDNSAYWNDVYSQYSSNSASYATITFANNKFLPLSGGTITGDLTINGSLTALGETTFIDTQIVVTSAMSITNVGTGPALVVNQTGSQPIANFQDDGSSALYIADGGNVGIGNASPSNKLDVNGTVAATGGNSNQWNSVYSTTNTNSATWSNWSTVSANYALSTSIVPTVTNHLSTNNVLLSGITISPIATNRNLARSLQDKFTEILSVKDFGARGDGISNDYPAIQSALNAISGTARLFIPRGTYVISQELRIGSNSYIYGEGMDTTTIRLSSTATASQNVLTNSQNTRSYLTNQGNENIVIKDLTVDGNNGRFPGSYSPGTNTNGCCIGFANVTNAIIENVGAYNAPNHCIDIAASEYSISTNPLVYTPGPSNQIHIKDVKAYGSGDDCITTHFSRNVLIENCYVTGSSGTLVPTNSNGLEIDDGSYDIFVLGGYVKNCIRGIEIKGHSTVPAAQRVRVQGLTVENCTRNFELRHIGFDSGNSATAFDVQLLNCTSISPVSTVTDAALRPRYLKISNYGGVVVRDFNCTGLCDTTNLVTVQEGAKDVLIDGLSFEAVSGNRTGITDSLLKIESNTLRNVTLRNIRFYNCVGLPFYATGSVPGLVIDGLYATATINPSSNYVINISWSPDDVPYTIKNVSVTGYLSAYTLGTINANYSVPRNVERIENIVPANASRAVTVARFGWREGETQGLNAGVGTRIDFTGNIFTGVSANQNVTVGYVGTEKINATDTDLSSNLVFGTADSNSVSASNKMLISPTGNVLVGTGSTTGLNSRLTVLGTISSSNIIFASGGNSNQWNSVYSTTNTNSATWSNWSTVSANYALGSQYVKLSGDTMTGGLSAANISLSNAKIITPASVSDSGQFLILNINGNEKAIRIWNFVE